MVKIVSFKAPWSTPLIAMTCFLVLVLIGMGALGLLRMMDPDAGSNLGLRTMPAWSSVLLLLTAVVSLFSGVLLIVRGYTVTDECLSITRLVWNTRVSLEGLISAQADPEATRSSMKLCGNGGMFAFLGWFRNSKYGTYRIFGTDVTRSVVLKFASRTVVVTPDDPQRFVSELRTFDATR